MGFQIKKWLRHFFIWYKDIFEHRCKAPMLKNILSFLSQRQAL
jgi:hypothetical protein